MSLPLQTPLAVYIGTGTAVQFAYNWYVIASADLVIKLNQVVQTADKYTVTGAGNITGGNVTFHTAPANGVEVVIQRLTVAERDTNYINNGDLLAETLNSDFDRVWMKFQDTAVITSSSITKPTGSGVWDAQGFRLGNLADGAQPQDAATYKQLTDTAGSAGASAGAAADSAASALSSANTATTQAGVATTQAGIATAQASAASGSATSALSSKNAAAASATSASTDSTTATTQAGISTTKAAAAAASATAAAASAALAQQYQPNTALQIMPALSSADNMDTFYGTTKNGRYQVNTATTATLAKNFPLDSFIGYVDVSPAGAGFMQTAYRVVATNVAPDIFVRYRDATTWSVWAKSGFNENDLISTAWTTATLQNGWTIVAGARAVYRKAVGLVFIDFHLQGGTISDSTILFNLPTGSRPAVSVHAVPFGIGAGNGIPPRIIIGSNGGVAVFNLASSSELHLTCVFSTQ